jgi:hypothetical protein
MTQNDLNRAVAAATGETVKTIADMGFVPQPCEGLRRRSFSSRESVQLIRD